MNDPVARGPGCGPVVDDALLARIEDAGLNAAAPPQQRLLGGWLLRLSPGKAKRARCVNALAVGSLPVDELLTRAEAVFQEAGLPFIVRITPFTQPANLDALLEARGLRRFDDTRVLLRRDLHDLPDLPLTPAVRMAALSPEAFAALSGRFRGSPPSQCEAHVQRLRNLPLTAIRVALVRREEGGEPIACAQAVLEGDLVGLYDVHVEASHRGQGHAARLCCHLLQLARREGAATAYLQVDADNLPARRLYAGLGFEDGYAYHYRTRDQGID